jgi:SOUL heme-binding protein
VWRGASAHFEEAHDDLGAHLTEAMHLSPSPPFWLALSRPRLGSRFAMGAFALVAVGAAALWVNTLGRRVEEPAYTIELRDGLFEIRRYAPRVVAETRVTGARDDAASEGFRRVAGYIFGANHRGQKIAMTAPVTQRRGEKIAMTAPVSQRADAAGWIVAFTMPSTHALASLPTPNDARVTLREVPAERVAVVRFADASDDDAVRTQTEALTQWLSAKGLRARDDAELNRYDPPWTLPFLRRNEVWITLDE